MPARSAGRALDHPSRHRCRERLHRRREPQARFHLVGVHRHRDGAPVGQREGEIIAARHERVVDVGPGRHRLAVDRSDAIAGLQLLDRLGARRHELAVDRAHGGDRIHGAAVLHREAAEHQPGEQDVHRDAGDQHDESLPHRLRLEHPVGGTGGSSSAPPSSAVLVASSPGSPCCT
jgi:hypothetical protein